MAFFFQPQALLPDLSLSRFAPDTMVSEPWHQTRPRPQITSGVRQQQKAFPVQSHHILRTEFPDRDEMTPSTAIYNRPGGSQRAHTGQHPDRTAHRPQARRNPRQQAPRASQGGSGTEDTGIFTG